MFSKKKKGIAFFTADSLIAGGIFVATVAILIAFYSNTPIAEDTKAVSNNFVDFITETNMATINQKYRYMYYEENDTLSKHTVHERVAYHIDNPSTDPDFNKTKKLIGEILNQTIPDQFGFEYVYNSFSVYNRSIANNPKTYISTPIATFYTNNNSKLVGPELTEVIVWS